MSLIGDALALEGIVDGIEIRTINNEAFRFDRTLFPQVPGCTPDEVMQECVRLIVGCLRGELSVFSVFTKASIVCIPASHIYHVLFDFNRPVSSVIEQALERGGS